MEFRRESNRRSYQELKGLAHLTGSGTAVNARLSSIQNDVSRESIRGRNTQRPSSKASHFGGQRETAVTSRSAVAGGDRPPDTSIVFSCQS